MVAMPEALGGNGRRSAAGYFRARKTPIVAGGTPMYLKLLLEGVSAGPPGKPEVRDALVG